MSNSGSRRFPVTVTQLPVTRCQICRRTVACRPGGLSEVLTGHYRPAHPEEPGRALELQGRKCGSCSMEINGRPRLACMTRMSIFEAGEPITITPLRTFPVIRDLVTDLSFNYAKPRQTPSFTPDPSIGLGEFRMQQVDVQRSQGFRKCIECYLCQNVCHVIRDHPENERPFAGPGSRCGSPSWRCTRPTPPTGARSHRTTSGSATATSPSAAPRSARRTSRSPTNALIPMKERVAGRKYDPLVWLGSKISRRPRDPCTPRVPAKA